MKIRILHIIKSLGRGGAEVLLPATLRFHDTNRFEFHYIYFLPWKDQMVESIRLNGGVVVCVSARNNVELMFSYPRVLDYVITNKIDLIHAHLPWAGILSRMLKFRVSVPVIYTEHNRLERYHWFTRRVNVLTMRLLDRVIVVSQEVGVSVTKANSKMATKLRKVLNGVNVAEFDRRLFRASLFRTQFSVPADAVVVGTVAVFRVQKRLDRWLEVASQIHKKRRDVYFVLVGDGPERPLVEQKVMELGLQSRVVLTGLQVEVRPFLAAFDIYLMTSEFEGLPVALLEAMSMECPVVATAVGGVAEVIETGVNGVTVPFDDLTQLVEHVDRLILEPEIRESIGARARQRVSDSFGIQRTVAELEGIYEDLLQRRQHNFAQGDVVR